MTPGKVFGIVLLAVLLVVALYWAVDIIDDESRFRTMHSMNGYWSAPSSFLQEAGLTTILFYYNEKNNWYFLLLEADGEVVLNSSGSLQYSSLRRTVRFMPDGEHDEEVWPLTATVVLNSARSTVVFSSGKEVLALLYRDAELNDYDASRETPDVEKW